MCCQRPWVCPCAFRDTIVDRRSLWISFIYTIGRWDITRLTDILASGTRFTSIIWRDVPSIARNSRREIRASSRICNWNRSTCNWIKTINSRYKSTTRVGWIGTVTGNGRTTISIVSAKLITSIAFCLTRYSASAIAFADKTVSITRGSLSVIGTV